MEPIGVIISGHYANYLKLGTALRLFFKPCMFLEEKKFVLLTGSIEIFLNKIYSVSSVFQNDLDDLKAWIWFVHIRYYSVRKFMYIFYFASNM